MAYQNPAFYFFHAARESPGLVIAKTGNTTLTVPTFPFYDSRMGEMYKWTTDIDAGAKLVQIDVDPLEPNIQMLDTLIIGPSNLGGSGGLGGARINAFTNLPDVIDMLADHVVTEDENGKAIILTLKDWWTPGDDFSVIAFNMNSQVGGGGEGGQIIPEVGEGWFTVKREMVRGPAPGWRHTVKRTQKRLATDAGVVSTWQDGPPRRSYRLTWNNLYGADRQVLLDMEQQTAGFAFPFWFTPPDDLYPTILVELDRESDWQGELIDPLIGGTSDRVTLPIVEALG